MCEKMYAALSGRNIVLRKSGMKCVLIVNPFGIGDVLFSTALVESLGRQVEGCHIGFLCNRRAEDLLKNNPLIDWVFVFEKDEYRELWKKSKVKCVKKFLSLLMDIRAKRFDTVIDLSLNRRFGFIAWLIGIPRRMGLNYKNRGIFLTDKINITGYNEKHIVEYYLSLLGLIELKPAANYLMLYISDEDRKWAKDFLAANGVKEGDMVIGIVPGGGASWGKDAAVKHWDKGKFSEVADLLAEKHSARILILGSEAERDICGSVKKKMKSAVINACGRTAILQFAALAGMCDLIIANDGGPLHIAVAMGAKTVGVFGPVDEKIYGQYPSGDKHRVVTGKAECRPCYKNFKLRECDIRKCLDTVTAQEVFNAAEAALKA